MASPTRSSRPALKRAPLPRSTTCRQYRCYKKITSRHGYSMHFGSAFGQCALRHAAKLNVYGPRGARPNARARHPSPMAGEMRLDRLAFCVSLAITTSTPSKRFSSFVVTEGTSQSSKGSSNSRPSGPLRGMIRKPRHPFSPSSTL